MKPDKISYRVFKELIKLIFKPLVNIFKICGQQKKHQGQEKGNRFLNIFKFYFQNQEKGKNL